MTDRTIMTGQRLYNDACVVRLHGRSLGRSGRIGLRMEAAEYQQTGEKQE